MTAAWTPAFEAMWRCRLQEMQNERQPFRRFIEMVVKSEIQDAFVLALNEIERLRSELNDVRELGTDTDFLQ
jgi:hypothetical protein